MNEKEDIIKIITDYFSGEISETDQSTLNEWLKIPANNKEFKAYAKANYLVVLQPNKFKPNKIEDNKPAIISLFKQHYMKVAAIFILLVAVGVIWKFAGAKELSLPSSDFVSVAINGQFQSLKSSAEQKILKDKDDNQIASYEKGILKIFNNADSSDLIINVPNGKNIKVFLSDGSEVLINAGSQLTFNSDFVKDHSRKVNLKGQAFFEVAKDKANPFYVITDQFTTKVLGTKFNISSYKNENESFVNLVEGKIEVSGTKISTQKILAPGEKISFSPEIKTPEIEAAKPAQDMDWLNKQIAFENNTTDEVLSKIERVYGLQIVRNRVDVENFHFSGTFKIENLDQITNTLEVLLNCKIQKDGTKLILISKN